MGALTNRLSQGAHPCPLTARPKSRRRQKTLDFSKNKYQLELDTSLGKITLDMLPDVAPGHVKNILGLAKIGYYDGLVFHRIIKGFMIQGGCPQGTGTGEPGYKIRPSSTRRRTRRACSRWPAPAIPTRPARSSSSAWSGPRTWTTSTRPSASTADDASLAVVKKIGAVKTGANDKPVEPVKINTAKVLETAKYAAREGRLRNRNARDQSAGVWIACRLRRRVIALTQNRASAFPRFSILRRSSYAPCTSLPRRSVRRHCPGRPADGNRLAYLDESDPYYVGRGFPKLITPQWVGEEGVEAVVVLAIDDMRGHEQVGGVPAADPRAAQADRRPGAGQHHDLPDRSRAIRTCRRGSRKALSLEMPHRSTIPARSCKDGDFAKAKATYDRCVDLLAAGPRQPAGRVPHAVLRFAEHAQPAVLRRDLQQDDARKGNFLTIDSLGLQRLHLRRPRAAARAGARRRRPRAVPQVRAARPLVREHDRELSVSLRDRPALLGVPLHDAQRLAGPAPAQAEQPDHGRATGRPPSTRRHQAGRLQPRLPPARLDPQRAGRSS